MPEVNSGLARTIDWKQGLFIALGVPVLILPSIYDVGSLIWGLSIFIWTISVCQGFVQNLTYGEMVTVFPNCTGIPGCAQQIYTEDVETKKYSKGRFLGAFCAWAYWFTWCPVLPVFSITIGDYLVAMFDLNFDSSLMVVMYVVIATLIVLFMYVIASHGLEGGATVGLILALISLIPLVIIIIGALALGMFDFSNITDNLTSPDWDWGFTDWCLLFGCLAIAQWSACAWETAAIYGPEYKDPTTDTPKALLACGFICLIMYFFVSFSVYGTLGQEGVEENGYATMVPIAEYAFGEWGSYIALFFLIVAMLLIIQTAYFGSSRALNSMAHEKNMPAWLGHLNKYGMPTHAFVFISCFSVLMVAIVEVSDRIFDVTATSMTLLTASAIGFCVANGMALTAYYLSRTRAKYKDLPRPFHMPRGYQYVALFMVFIQFIIFIPCVCYWSYVSSDGYIAILMGVVILLIYIPVWFWVRKKEWDKTHGGDAVSDTEPEAEPES